MVAERAPVGVDTVEADGAADPTAAEVICSVTGREAVLLGSADGVGSATRERSAELIPTATTAQPATASDAVAAPTTRPTDMWSVCQV